MASTPPALSDNPYDNYVKEILPPPKPEAPTRERCSNVRVIDSCICRIDKL